MSQFMNLCRNRQSCRKFADKPVEHEKLVQIIEAARLAPSACNSQPWRFVVAENPETVAQIAKAGQQLGINDFLTKAKAFIVILENHAVLMPKLRTFIDSQYFARGDIGAAAVTTCYAATDLGLGSCIIGLYDRQMIADALNLPADQRFGALIAIGYPEEANIRQKARKDINDIARFV